jgi:transcriptional regulator with XRE-family HTH domain
MSYKYGNKIYQIRIDNGFSQKIFSDIMNCSRNKISNIELNISDFDSNFIENLYKKLNVNLNWLFGDEKNMYRK